MAAPGYETFGEPADPEGETISEVKSSLVQHKAYCGPALQMKDFNRKIEGPFVSVWLHNVPWGGEDALAAPDAKVGVCYFEHILNWYLLVHPLLERRSLDITGKVVAM